MTAKIRCPYFELNDQGRAYHDKEWGTPCRKDRKLFEYLMYDHARFCFRYKELTQ